MRIPSPSSRFPFRLWPAILLFVGSLRVIAAEPAQPDHWPVQLHVVGNQILRPDGTSVWLQGVNVVSLEFRIHGEHVLRAAQVAIEEWKSNIVRLPVKEDYWFGRDKSQTDGGAAYRELVDSVITLIANR